MKGLKGDSKHNPESSNFINGPGVAKNRFQTQSFDLKTFCMVLECVKIKYKHHYRSWKLDTLNNSKSIFNTITTTLINFEFRTINKIIKSNSSIIVNHQNYFHSPWKTENRIQIPFRGLKHTFMVLERPKIYSNHHPKASKILSWNFNSQKLIKNTIPRLLSRIFNACNLFQTRGFKTIFMDLE